MNRHDTPRPHHRPALSDCSLLARAQASAERGAVEVTEQLRRLREQGLIDEDGDTSVVEVEP